MVQAILWLTFRGLEFVEEVIFHREARAHRRSRLSRGSGPGRGPRGSPHGGRTLAGSTAHALAVHQRAKSGKVCFFVDTGFPRIEVGFWQAGGEYRASPPDCHSARSARVAYRHGASGGSKMGRVKKAEGSVPENGEREREGSGLSGNCCLISGFGPPVYCVFPSSDKASTPQKAAAYSVLRKKLRAKQETVDDFFQHISGRDAAHHPCDSS